MEEGTMKLSFEDLGVILCSIYFQEEQDFTNTEDLIDFLTSEENADRYVEVKPVLK